MEKGNEMNVYVIRNAGLAHTFDTWADAQAWIEYLDSKTVEIEVGLPEDMHFVTNLMSGKQVLEAKDTPYSCSVASEAYWCQ